MSNGRINRGRAQQPDTGQIEGVRVPTKREDR